MPRVAVVLLGVVGCVAPPFQRVASAPKLAPNENALIVERPPSGAILLGTVNLQLSTFQLPTDCTAQALAEARGAGATHIVMPTGTPATSTKGPRCSAQAYYLPPR
jgi:hypothetical protein